ncbi:MAG: cysteine synthase A [Anaerovoracaceae bacterium]
MSNIARSLTDLIGKTPLLALERYGAEFGGNILAKLEAMNPGGSAKDRVAKSMIEDAEARGILHEGSVIIEPTSGNTGIGIAAVATAKGYRTILTMPETMSIERRNLLAAYGAELVLTPGKEGMIGAVKKAEELAETMANPFIPAQFDNPANPKAHRETTGPEIWEDTDGNVDILVSAIGTGGTLTGTGQYLKTKNPNLKIVAVEPAASPLLSKGEAGPHGLQGIGANFVPSILDKALIDEIICVTEDEAYQEANLLTKKEGVLCGISSGAALYAAKVMAMRSENKGKNIVVVLPDTGERYLSTKLFNR